jgi:hypothetical protein
VWKKGELIEAFFDRHLRPAERSDPGSRIPDPWSLIPDP